MISGLDHKPAGSSRLQRLAQRTSLRADVAGSGAPTASAASASKQEERCGLCSVPVESEHRHVLDLSKRQLLCTCRACSLLFDGSGAGGRHYRLIPERCLRLEKFTLTDALWTELRIPVDMAFFFFNSALSRTVALYPGPMGATESLLPLTAWEELIAGNDVLASMAPDVEALLLNRTRGAREYWLVPVDACYTLVGLIRMHWKGLSGGEEAWDAIARYFDELRGRATTVRCNTTEMVNTTNETPSQYNGAESREGARGNT